MTLSFLTAWMMTMMTMVRMMIIIIIIIMIFFLKKIWESSHEVLRKMSIPVFNGKKVTETIKITKIIHQNLRDSKNGARQGFNLNPKKGPL